MPYQISPADKNELGAALAAYYEDAFAQGIKGLMDRIARSNMGVVTGYLDQGKDTWASLRSESKDAFMTTFKSTLKLQVSTYLANRNDVASVLVTVGEQGLRLLASHIPVPHLGAVVSAGISFAAGKAQTELHSRSIIEADGMLQKGTGAAPVKLFTNDAEAGQLAAKAMDQYKTICNYIKTLPTNITTFDDAITFPGAVFKVQQAASALNVALDNVQRYLNGMQERLQQISKVMVDYKGTLANKMPAAVDAVLQKAYADAHAAGKKDVDSKKFAAVPLPKFQKPTKPGGASLLAAYMAHAVAQGYYDAGNSGPQITRPRAVGAPPPVPARPSSFRR